MIDWYVNIEPDSPERPTRPEGPVVTMKAPRHGTPSDDNRVDWKVVPTKGNINTVPLKLRASDDPEDGGYFHNSVELPPYGLDEYDFSVSVRGRDEWKTQRLVARRKLFFKMNWSNDGQLQQLWADTKDDFIQIFSEVGIELECLEECPLNIAEPFDGSGDIETGSRFREEVQNMSPYPKQHEWQFFRIVLVKSGTTWGAPFRKRVELTDTIWDGNNYCIRLKMPLSETKSFSRRDMLNPQVVLLNQTGRFADKFPALTGPLDVSSIAASKDQDYSYVDLTLDSALNNDLRLLAEWQQFYHNITGTGDLVLRDNVPGLEATEYGNEVMQWNLFSDLNTTSFPQVEVTVRTSEKARAFVAGTPVIILSEEAVRAKVVDRTNHPAAMARILAHELGHLLDMVPKTREFNNKDNPHPTFYLGKGAQGPHCSNNTSEVAHTQSEAGDFYESWRGNKDDIYIPSGTGADGPCIMFGITHARQHEVTFCEECSNFLRAGDLSIAGMQKLKKNDVDWDEGY